MSDIAYNKLTDEQRGALLKKWGWTKERIEEAIVKTNYERLKDRMIVTERGIIFKERQL